MMSKLLWLTVKTYFKHKKKKMSYSNRHIENLSNNVKNGQNGLMNVKQRTSNFSLSLNYSELQNQVRIFNLSHKMIWIKASTLEHSKSKMKS